MVGECKLCHEDTHLETVELAGELVNVCLRCRARETTARITREKGHVSWAMSWSETMGKAGDKSKNGSRA